MLRSGQMPPTTPDPRHRSVQCGRQGGQSSHGAPARAGARAGPKRAKRQNTSTAKQPTKAAVQAGLENREYQNCPHTETFGRRYPHPSPGEPRSIRVRRTPAETDPHNLSRMNHSHLKRPTPSTSPPCPFATDGSAPKPRPFTAPTHCPRNPHRKPIPQFTAPHHSPPNRIPASRPLTTAHTPTAGATAPHRRSDGVSAGQPQDDPPVATPPNPRV